MLRLFPSPGFGTWLRDRGGTLVFSTYQTGRLVMLGADEGGAVHGSQRVVGTAMGLHIDKNKMWVANRDQIWRFANVGPGHVDGADHDAIYMPRQCFMVGGSDCHDVIADVRFRGVNYPLLYANTRFSCVAAPDNHYSVLPVWMPDFISTLTPEDRCHLNGICARDGELAYATACAVVDTVVGWRSITRIGAGIVIDIQSGNVICRGLTMPHSPRWHEGRLWLLDSGTAKLGYVDMDAGRFVPVADCPGFARGLTFIDGHAVVGLSRLRQSGSVFEIGILEVLAERKLEQRAGLLVIDIANGQTLHWVQVEGGTSELYDVAFIPGIHRAYTPGFREPRLHSVMHNVPAVDLPIRGIRPDTRTPLPTTARLEAERRAADNSDQTSDSREGNGQ